MIPKMILEFLNHKVSLFTMTGVLILVFIGTFTIQTMIFGDTSNIDFRCYTPDQLFNENGITVGGNNIQC